MREYRAETESFDHPSVRFVEWAACVLITGCVKELIPLHDCGYPPMGFRGHPDQG